MDQETQTASKTPIHLWIVGVILVLWQGLAAFDYLATIFRWEFYLANFPEDMLEYIYSAPWWMWIMWAFGTIGGLIGVILMLMRNKLAVPVFAAALAGGIISNFWMVATAPEGFPSNNIFTAIILLIAAGVMVYIIWLKDQGVLR